MTLLWSNKESFLAWANIWFDFSSLTCFVFFLSFFELARVKTPQHSGVTGEKRRDFQLNKCRV